MKMLVYIPAMALLCCAGACNFISEEPHGSYTLIHQKDGPTLGYSPDSGVGLLKTDGKVFKDLNRNGMLDIYEDWRRPDEERARDLAAQMSIEQICGLMMYSSAVHLDTDTLLPAHRTFLERDFVRHVLVASVKDARTAASWSNRIQAFCEAAPLGIPANNSSDPRNYSNGKAYTGAYAHEPDGEFDPDGTDAISRWPREIGLGATFDPELVRRHAEIAAAEYRAMGITTALSPQADMATDPRWRRFYGTFGESPELCRDMTRAYCDGFQTTENSSDGWGLQSVNCMVKHWPGGGTGEGGRDAHFGTGKYAVYPGDGFRLQLTPFTEGAFKLDGNTKSASAVMPYYTIPYGQDPSGENVANGFSRYIIQELLRDGQNYEGVVCTDWGIVKGYARTYIHEGTPWGMETASAAEKRLKVFEAGVDQLGGVSDVAPSLDAYHLWEEKYGAESARERFELSARRLLRNIFRVGVFENPYVDPEEAARLVGCKEYVAEGYDAQRKAVVLLKNHAGVLPLRGRLKVYEPLRHMGPALNHWQHPLPAYDEYPFSKELLGQYYEVVDTPEEADFALVSIKSPFGHWGYMTPKGGEKEGHYSPISLQYGPYTATHARARSLAGGDPSERSDNRSYLGVTERSANESDMLLVRETRKRMGSKPVVLVVAMDRPFVPAEIEPAADAIILSLGVCNNALLDAVSGKFEPSGLLPCQLPADMLTVEEQCEDLPFDMRPYVDADGNRYDFAFGLNWNGAIRDARTERYAPAASARGGR